MKKIIFVMTILTSFSIFASGKLTSQGLINENVTNGCLRGVCVGDKIFKRAIYGQGAIVLAVNEFKKTVLVRSISNPKHLENENPRFLDSTSGCVGEVCVGDLVFKGSTYSKGATVVALNKKDKTVLVRSAYNPHILNTEKSSDLDN